MPFPTHRLLLLLLPAALTSGAAARTSPILPASDQATQAYVQGRLALADDDLAVAAQRFERALQANPDDLLKRRALDVAMLSGDTRTALRMANAIALPPESEPQTAIGDSLVALTRLAGAAAARDWRAYDAARQAFAAPGRQVTTNRLLGTLVEAYGLAGQGDLNAAIALLDRQTERGISASYITEHRAHLLALAKRWPEAADGYAAIVNAEGANVARLRIAAAAAALEAARNDPAYRSRAITILGGGPERDPVLVHARQRLGSDPKMDGRRLGGLPSSLQEAFALLLLRVATDLARERALGPAISFARLATLADPTVPDGWFVTADTLVRADKPDLALAALDKAPPSEPWSLLADVRRAAILSGQARHDEALAIATRLAGRPDAGPEDWSRLADVARRAGRTADATAAYGRALDLLPPTPGPIHAQLWFLRGSANEVAGNWAAAEPDLRRAVEAQPDNPLMLNYLGYSLLDRGRNVAEARGLIERAFKAAPDNAAITDSMGWAEYASGNYAEAVRLLEKARAAEPADPTIADHLGDALWKAGRRIEARHAWASAAALSPEPKLSASLAHKMDYGLDVAFAGK